MFAEMLVQVSYFADADALLIIYILLCSSWSNCINVSLPSSQFLVYQKIFCLTIFFQKYRIWSSKSSQNKTVTWLGKDCW